MTALQVVDVKDFMAKLLGGEVFDNFLLMELDVANYAAFHLSGRRNRDWYSEEEWEAVADKEYVTWREIRPVAFQWVKGHRTPLSMKGVLVLSGLNTERILERNYLPFRREEVGGLFLNFRYEAKELQLVTGISMNSFTMDKALEHQWDEDVRVFLRHHGIAVEEM